MAIFLDSAAIDDARSAAAYGFVFGATTNPTLLVRAGHGDFWAALSELCGIFPGPVFYQLVAHELPEMREEYQHFRRAGPNLAFKIPCTLLGLQFAAEVSRETVVAVTSIFHPSQAYLSAQAGARYVIPYVNRLTRSVGHGPAKMAEMSAVLHGTTCEVLAAGIKSAEEAVESVLAGAHHISTPLDVITGMAENVLSQAAIAEFDAALPYSRRLAP